MKLLFSLILLIILNFSNSQSIPTITNCDKFLNKFKDSNKCIQISISGTNKDNLAQEGYKGNLKFNNVTNVWEIQNYLSNLQTYETICLDGLYQPFSSIDSFRYTDFKIFLNGTLRINNVFFSDLYCFSNDDFVFYKLNNFLYSLSMKSYTTCPQLLYGESCVLPSTPSPTNSSSSTSTSTSSSTPTPSNTPSNTPTPTSSSKYNIKFENTLNNQWERNNVMYYQFTTILVNNEKSSIKTIELVNDSNWSATEIWSLDKLSNGNYGFPDYINSLGTSSTFSFGFVSTIKNPSIKIKLITF